MSFFKKLFGSKKNEVDAFIDKVVKQMDHEKKSTGQISKQTFKDVSEGVIQKLMAGELSDPSADYKPLSVKITNSANSNQSKDHNYTVLWQDGYETVENWLSGIVQLKKDRQIIYEVDVERPFECKVSDVYKRQLQVLAYMGVPAYDKFLKKEGYRSKADPETYLRNRYWENEYA